MGIDQGTEGLVGYLDDPGAALRLELAAGQFDHLLGLGRTGLHGIAGDLAAGLGDAGDRIFGTK